MMETLPVPLEAQIVCLKDALHIDQTGLVRGLNAIRALADGYFWVTEGYGPYARDDDEYRQEMRRLIEGIATLCQKTLTESGNLAHVHCCERAPRRTVIDTLQEEIAAQSEEIARLRAEIARLRVGQTLLPLQYANDREEIG